MERSQLFDLMGELQLYGMKAAFDEIMATAVKRQHEPQRMPTRISAATHHLSGISFYGFEAPEGDHGPVGPACSLVSAVSPATVPSCMVSTTVLGTITSVALCFKPS